MAKAKAVSIEDFHDDPKRGKKPNQKLKPYIVLDYFLKESDIDHPKTADDVQLYLEGFDIYSQRASIYDDIKEINKVFYMLQEGCTPAEAEEAIKDDFNRIIHNHSDRKKGYYAMPLTYDFSDVQLIAECIYASKFISEKEEKRLIGVVADLLNKHQKEKIIHDTFAVGRVKTNNKEVLSNILWINEAMSTKIDGEAHTPCKISFSYLTHGVGQIEKLVPRKRKYVVSPYQLMITDNNYYLLCYDDKYESIRTYRVDRMSNVQCLDDEPREGKEEFEKIDLKTYNQRHFSMFSGERKEVEMVFTNNLLDTVLDKLGTRRVFYTKADEEHFRVNAIVEVSPQFYGWLAGLGNRVVVETPEVAEQYKAFLDKIRAKYQ